MEKTTRPNFVSSLTSRLKMGCKIAATTLALASTFSYSKMVYQRAQENTQQEINKLFAEGDATPDTSTMLNEALQKHPYLGIHSKLYFDERVRQLHNALGRPEVNHYTNSKWRKLMPFISMNHYDALGRTCYIQDATILQWLTEAPHAYQHQQEGIVSLTLDLCVGTVRSWLHTSFYDKSYELPNSLEYHAHRQVEPALLSSLFTHDYGVALIEDLKLLPNADQGKAFLQYCNQLTIYGASDIQLILRTDAGKLLREWMRTHDGWYKIINAIAISSTEYKKYRSTFLFTHLMLDAVQMNEIALLCYNDPLYLADRKKTIVETYQKNTWISGATARTLFAVQIQEALLHCHQHPMLQSDIFDIFFEHACTYAYDGLPAPSKQILPFTLKNESYKNELEALYLKAYEEKIGRGPFGKFTFTYFGYPPRKISQ